MAPTWVKRTGWYFNFIKDKILANRLKFFTDVVITLGFLEVNKKNWEGW